MHHLGRADAVEDLHAESALPLIEQRLGQGLARADTGPHRRQVVFEVRLRVREQGRVEGRRGEEDRRPFLRDQPVDEVGRRSLGLVDRRRADAEGEEHTVAQPVRVEERRDGEMPVVLGRAQHGGAVGVARVDHVVLQMDRALRESGRPRAVHPHARVVRRRVDGRQLVVGSREELIERQNVRRAFRAARDHVPQSRCVPPDIQDLLDERAGGDHRDGAAVVQDVREVARCEQGVGRHGDRADLDRAEECVDELGRVQAEDDHALFDADPELAQRVPAAIDVGAELGVRDRPSLAADGDALVTDAAMRVDERLGGVVPIGQLRKTHRPHGRDYVPRLRRGVIRRDASRIPRGRRPG